MSFHSEYIINYLLVYLSGCLQIGCTQTYKVKTLNCTISLNKTTVVCCSFKYVMAEEYVIVIRIVMPLTPSVDDQDLPHPATVSWYLNDSYYYYIDSNDDDAQYAH